ncbi:non-ribosomal peptide synthetase [Paenibacillus sp. EKM211P]|uniref:non-ribosomal peptide synthetase n=1 Tax=Paenibacillus sp. EKM211P TaxID=1683679 RepID=UPI0013E97DEE|nr:non-ribosomal peptide synthetase [Paenibacillus sp. EKM211P]KAF6582672.1 amino acid adenylation domain-containing protein [Paenibacillus sp. EKM211P]
MNKYESLYPLTHAQKRIWFIEQQYPHTSIHLLGGLIKIHGVPDIAILKQAIQLCIDKHDGLRLEITELNGQPYQHISQTVKDQIDYIDFSIEHHNDVEVVCKQWAKAKMAEPFTFLNNPLYYFAICKLNEHQYGYLIKLHHIISDGWTTHILTQQICDWYTQLIKNNEIVNECQPSYLDYIDNEQIYLNSKRFYKNRIFWKERFKKLPEYSSEKVGNEVEGQRMSFELGLELSNKLKDFSQRKQISLNAFFNALMILYIHKMTQQVDIIIGSPVLNRSGQAERKMVGMFTSTMPFRLELTTEDSLMSFLQMANKELLSCFANQKYPFDLLVQDLELQKKGRDYLFNICVNYYNTNLVNTMAGMTLENEELHTGDQLYSLQMVITEWSDQHIFTLHYDYKKNDYQDYEINQMHHYMILILEQIVSNDQLKVSEISLLSLEEERHLLYEWNPNIVMDDIHSKSIHQLFEEQAAKTPDNVAISFEEKSMTYKALNEKANQLARLLTNKYIGPGCHVAIIGDHCQEIIISMLAVLKAGACYVPLDPEYPRERIEYILNDANVTVILADNVYDPELKYTGEIIYINEGSTYEGDFANLHLPINPDALAYIIYTSGTTGMPKGVMVPHRGVVNYITWAKEQYIHNTSETFAFHSSIAFDLTATSIFTPLINGNTIVIYKKSTQEHVLERIVHDNRTNIIKVTPAHLALLANLKVDNSAIRCIIVGGEELRTNISRQIYDVFNRKIDIYNEYGPTEATVGCMIHRFDPELDTRITVPIGSPINNMQIYVLDCNMKLVPKGAQGEIYISGLGVACGYLGQEELTAEKFISSPFREELLLYKTGDLGKFLDNGLIEYLGRIDQQVKINGYRIETGEVEHHLLEHEKVADAIVTTHNEAERNYLVAFIVAKEEIAINELNRYLAERVPYYMVPMIYKFIDKIPLTANGKVNRIKLNEQLIIQDVNEESTVDPTELVIIEIYKKILNINEVGVNDHFYRIGGDSIKAIQVTSKLRELNYDVKVQDIMTHPTIKQLSTKIKEGEGVVVPQKMSEGEIKPLPIICWFLEQKLSNVHHWNQSVFLKMKKNLNVSILELVVKKLFQHHDGLRMNYNSNSGNLYYNPKYLVPAEVVHYYDLSAYDEIQQKGNIQRIGNITKASFDIESSVLFKACLFDCGYEKGTYVLMTAHHFIIDAMSWRVILEDFSTLLKQFETNQSLQLPLKTHSVQRWANTLNEYKNNDFADELLYWENEIATDFSFIRSNTNESLDCTSEKLIVTNSISAEETDLLLTSANVAYNTRPLELLVTALVKSISCFTEQDKIVIEMEGHGREEIAQHIDVTRTVGWFTSIFPVLFELKNQALDQQIVAVKEKLRKIPNNGINFGVLRYLTPLLSSPKNKNIRFNYLGQFDQKLYDDTFEIVDSALTGHDVAVENELTSVINIVAMVLGGQLQISISFSSNSFIEAEMNHFLSSFIDRLRDIIKHCSGKELQLFTPSDFDSVSLSQEELEMLFE